MTGNPVPLNLAGLSICRIDGDKPAPGAHDLVWRHHPVPRVGGRAATDAPFFALRDEMRGDVCPGGLTFGHSGRVRCRFLVGADGRTVESWSVPEVSEHDLLALFGEHILRAVLVRRGLVSFHSACLRDGEGAILIMGDKGMGKSTLSSALQQRGWSAVADDLTRVAETDGSWQAFAGLRDTKLLPDSIAALGLEGETLPRRWDDSAGAGDGKRLLSPLGEPPVAGSAFRLAALLVLQPRRQGRSGLFHRFASPIEAVRSLVHHSTYDPSDPQAPPPPAVQRAIGGLVRRLPVIELALPDRLDSLAASAEAVEAVVRGIDGRRAA